MNSNVKISVLLDLYGKVLSKIQFDSLDLYYNQDLSLSEIAKCMGKSRQGVYDSIKRSERILSNMENLLGFFDKIYKINEDSKKIFEIALEMESDSSLNRNPSIKCRTRLIKKLAQSLISQTYP